MDLVENSQSLALTSSGVCIRTFNEQLYVKVKYSSLNPSRTFATPVKLNFFPRGTLVQINAFNGLKIYF